MQVTTEIAHEAFSMRLQDKGELCADKRALESEGRFHPDHLLEVLGLADTYKNTVQSSDWPGLENKW